MKKITLMICAGLALLIVFGFLTDGRKIDELPTQISNAEKPSPTPTSSPEPRPTYLYGKASWYGNEYCHNKPCRTANGDWFDDSKFTCACNEDFPLGSMLVVSYEENSVEVLCNDKGNFTKNYRRVVDLSKAAFMELAPNSKGVIEVRVRRVE